MATESYDSSFFAGIAGHADYWAKKFKANHYVVADAVRHRVWMDDWIAWYYRQNLLVYVDAHLLKLYPGLLADHQSTHESLLSIIHPGMYRGLQYTTSPENQSLRNAIALFGRTCRAAVKRHLGGKKS